jgi:hypothetical protein
MLEPLLCSAWQTMIQSNKLPSNEINGTCYPSLHCECTTRHCIKYKKKNRNWQIWTIAHFDSQKIFTVEKTPSMQLSILEQ